MEKLMKPQDQDFSFRIKQWCPNFSKRRNEKFVLIWAKWCPDSTGGIEVCFSPFLSVHVDHECCPSSQPQTLINAVFLRLTNLTYAKKVPPNLWSKYLRLSTGICLPIFNTAQRTWIVTFWGMKFKICSMGKWWKWWMQWKKKYKWLENLEK